MFYKISSSVGSGKTQAVLEHISTNLDVGYLIVSPTVDLCTDIYKRLLNSLAGKGEEVVPYINGNVVRLVVEDKQLGAVFPRAKQACQEFNANIPPIVIVTTVTFEFLLANLSDDEKAQFKVFIDEGLSPIQTEQFSPKNNDEFLSLFDQSEDGFITAKQGSSEIVEWVAVQPNKLAAAGLEHFDIPAFRQICKLVHSRNYDVFLDTIANSIRIVAVLSPQNLKSFASVVMIVAIFERTLLPILWQQRHAVEFVDFPLNDVLYDTHIEKGAQIKIWHLHHPSDGPSKRNLTRNWETGDDNEKDPVKQVIYHAAQIVNDTFPEGAFCWCANNFFQNTNTVLEGRRMPPICAGLNDFKRFHTVVSLLSMNPDAWIKTVMIKLFDLEDGQLYELWRFSHTYQMIGRCSLRVREYEGDINIVVLSKRCADQLHELFVGSEVVGQLGNLPRYSGLTIAEARREGMGIQYTRNDNAAFSKYNKRNRENGLPSLSKEQWYETERKKWL